MTDFPPPPAFPPPPPTTGPSIYGGESDKEWLVAVLLSWFVGTLGIDRFYLGYTGIGIAKLLTFGGCGVWALIDAILITVGRVKDAQGRPLRR
jgi:TM2 domain-containing membrane protein YozV